MGLLTDAVLKYVLGALSLGLLLTLGQQEIKLRHELSTANRSLDIEIQCRVGSTCAQKLSDEARRGAVLVEQARAAAAADFARQKAALEQQAVDAVRQQQATQAAAQKAALAWKQKYDEALLTPACGAWAKQVNACALQ